MSEDDTAAGAATGPTGQPDAVRTALGLSDVVDAIARQRFGVRFTDLKAVADPAAHAIANAWSAAQTRVENDLALLGPVSGNWDSAGEVAAGLRSMGEACIKASGYLFHAREALNVAGAWYSPLADPDFAEAEQLRVTIAQQFEPAIVRLYEAAKACDTMAAIIETNNAAQAGLVMSQLRDTFNREPGSAAIASGYFDG